MVRDMVKFTTSSKWKMSQDILKQFDNYETVNIGLRWVETERIIGLSLCTPNEIVADDKMKRLLCSVLENEWKDESPVDLHLYRIPDSKYVVATGGNHRPVLACELGIAQIEACVDVLIPIRDMKQDVLQKIHGVDSQIKWLEHEARELGLFLRSNSIHGDEYEAENRRYNECFEEIEKLYQERRETLIVEAIRLGYMVEEERN